jgi:hypothetical protein
MRYLASGAKRAHVVVKDSPCSTVRQNVDAWKGQRSIKPEDVIDNYKDCAKCDTHTQARKELLNPQPEPKRRSNVVKLVTSNAIPAADERTTKKAKEHADLAREHGWDVNVTTNVRRGLTIIASKGDEICVLAYRENGILWNDEIQFKVPGRSVPMHNSGTWRRQVSLPEGKRPVPARPKRFSNRKPSVGISLSEVGNSDETEDETEADVIPLNKSSLPFLKDADDAEIADAIKGQMLFWRNNMAAKVASARVPTKTRMIRFNLTKHGRRFVSFPETEFTKDGEMWGAERSVAIEDMLRVRP